MHADVETELTGRALDAEIARVVFGVKRLYMLDGSPWDGTYEYPQYIPSGKPWRTHSIDATVLPWFSRDIGSAWQIVQQAGVFSVTIEDIDGSAGGMPAVTFFSDRLNDDNRSVTRLGASVAEAICHAALALAALARPSEEAPNRG